MKILVLAALSMFAVSHSYGMIALDDQSLSKVDGQALLNLQYQSGTNSTDSMGISYDQSNIGFYKLGLDAEMELNANIKSLQLGCGYANAAAKSSQACDINIDNIALSGLVKNADGTIKSDYTSDERAATSAVITNPFIQFAIKNPTLASTREVLGFRVSAEKIAGLMTLGTENSSTPNGIKSFSGYMKTKEASGTAITNERHMIYDKNTFNYPIKGKVSGCLIGDSCSSGLEISYESNGYDLILKSAYAPFTINSTQVSGSRMTKVDLKGSGTVGQLDFYGDLTAQVLGLLNLDKVVTGNITGLKTDISVSQDLGLIHALYLNNAASLSLQQVNLLWPGASAGANKGWWLAMEDEVDLGSLSPTTNVDISNAVLQQTIAGISKNLTDNPRACGNLLSGCIGGSTLGVGNIPLTTSLDFPLVNLTLQGQNFKSNCFGGLKFC
ncbi:hypothetical protein GFH30_09920 [Acinetobacter wanghuae]|uniref:Uncharacterized protein n=1 Tax=Acinetobacter wanghuae TaxID=2662362 RepID=A0A5Q0P4I9_9GAMM|nr:hypothetical protein [Acinetobacter wanghuae]MQW91423.1 hypothetical protein [Acinetobacter wanghuae]QGA11674.1 hypothetical protein GFH30_09920 [Acinetobacter wanghuae]